MRSFDEIFEDKTKYGTKIKTSEYKEIGKYAIIDQGQEEIAGYTDLEKGVFEDVPAIIFGDHTRVIKYVRDPFFLGADGVKILKCKELNVNYKYLYYALKNAKIPNTGYNRHFKWLKQIQIEYPSIDKQEKIVKILDKVVMVIEDRRKEIQELDKLIKARFVEMFGDPIKNPKGWDVVKLSECLERIDNGKSFTCDSNAREGAFPAILKLSAATYGNYRPYENKALLDEKQFVESVEVHRGDLLFTRKNTPDLVGMAAYVFETPEKLMMPDLIFRLVTNERMTPIFLWQLINNREYRSVIQGISGGSAKSMSNISKERLKNIEVICPPISEQKKLEGVLVQVNKSKVAVQKALDEAQLLFDSLMQEYFG